MTTFHSRQRGEGKLGCIISLVVIAVVAGAAYKAFPVYYDNRELLDFAKDVGPKASGIKNPESIEAMVRTKAKELDIPEILQDPTAISVTLIPSSGESPGKCTIRIKYKRNIDFYGFYTYSMVTDETISSVIYTNIG
ncbi:MAG TPA: hypothetical protein VJ600_10190 [Holophagaceae bacterium]|nr:hypothetical protein [Holophagaceae bacterium]